ncbi:dihydrofolate reductase [Tamaricihabitans halophyticus]|uniref:Dihydrofolate reductase n=1 Tax=Tamaricihabitans halophyticus TaxID=1262583 RepID=A0A4R2R6S4_9PSEU|nr:dihydrofolate reductase family protein [Tamaricihabitans halophyticus]TCP55045.1 dihydrofolate reductase [Tamaricihabitans halophyticus]
MRTVSYTFSVSLDGYIEDGNGGISWTTPDPEVHEFFNEMGRGIDVSLYGRRLYESMSGFWPTVDDSSAESTEEADYAKIWAATPKIVFSTTLTKVDHNSRLVRENPEAEVRALKAQQGKEIEVGGAGLAASLMRADLIDEYRMMLFPVVLGSGKPYFTELNASLPLELVETRTFGSGAVYLCYRRIREA